MIYSFGMFTVHYHWGYSQMSGTKPIVLFDTETDGFSYSTIHCTAVAEPNSKEPELLVGIKELEDWAKENTDSDTLWVGHNVCGFDYWVVNELTNITIPRNRVADTSVLTKLHDYRKYHTHSLDEIGTVLGQPKTNYTGGWDKYTPEMGSYCKDDVRTLQKIWKVYGRLYWSEASYVEHDMSLILAEMQRDGFMFDTFKAKMLLEDVQEEMLDLETAMQKQWPPELVEDRRIQWRTKDDGTPYATCLKAMDKAPKWKIEGSELVLYKYKQFNPGSPKDRVDKLWDAGWSPWDKTKGHIQFEREQRWTS